MAPFSLSRSKHLLPFAAVLKQAGEPVGRILSKANLPGDCLDDPQSVIPSYAVFRFRELSGEALDRTNLALDATRNLDLTRLGAYGRAMLESPTMYCLMTRFRDHLNTETTITRIELQPLASGDLFFCYRFDRSLDTGVWHSDLYTFRWVLKILRLVTPSWTPSSVCSLSPSSRERREVFDQLGVARVEFQRDCTGFSIPASMLALPLTTNATGTEQADSSEWKQAALPTTNADGLQQVIRTYSSDHWLSLPEAAEVLNHSARTIQRRLAEEKTTYSGVVEGTRAQVGAELLESTDTKIGQIATHLGYRGHSNFTRAFKRWAGVTPHEYRRRRLEFQRHG